MTSLESSCRNSVVDVEVRGGVDLADYAEHLSRTPLRCGVASGTAPDTVALAFAEERTWRYVSALVGLPAPGRLRIEVTAASKDVRAVADQVCRILSLDVDGSGFPMVVAGDPVLARRVRAGPGLRPALFCSPYEAACWAVVCHRLRLMQTDALVRRIAERRGRTLRVGGREVVCFPAPRDHAWARLLVRAVRREAASAGGRRRSGPCGRTRCESAAGAARRRGSGAGAGALRYRAVLRRTRGGRGAGQPDLFPEAESHLVAALRRYYDTDDAGVLAAAERWRPYRGWASFFFREVPIDEQ